MKERLRDKAFKNFFYLAHKIYDPEIIVDAKLIYELIDTDPDDEEYYLDAIKIKILKKRIGIYNYGEIVCLDNIAREFGINAQTAGQIIVSAINEIYKKNTENKAEIIKVHPTMQNNFAEREVEELGLNHKKNTMLKEKGYKKIKDILDLDEDKLKEEFNGNNQEIIERMNMFGYKPKNLTIYEDNNTKYDKSIIELLREIETEQEKIRVLIAARDLTNQRINLSQLTNKEKALKEIELELNNITLTIQLEEDIVKDITRQIREKINNTKQKTLIKK